MMSQHSTGWPSMRITAMAVVMIACISPAWSQCPTANFAMSAAACLNESVVLNNTSTGAVSYQWDFCSGDLVSQPTVQVVASGLTIFRARTFRMVQASGSWYGFAIDENYSLVRFDFGNNPVNTPVTTIIGNLSGAIQLALDLRFWQEGANWFACVANTSADNILLLRFGTDLASIPSVTNLGSLGGILKGPAGIDLLQDAGNLYALVANSTASEVIRLDFGSSITNTPAVTVISMAGAGVLRGISITRECDRWFALITDNGGNKLYYIDFITGIQNSPATGILSIPTASYSSPAGISIKNEGGLYFAFVQSVFPSNLYRIDFGQSIVDQIGTYNDLGNLNINTAPGNSQFNGAFELVVSGTTWTGYSIDLSGPNGIGNLLQINFSDACSANPPVSSNSSPPPMVYTSPGIYRVSLTALNNDGWPAYNSKLINVSTDLAPDIDFMTQNICVNHNVSFISSNVSGNITSYNWDFGDTGTSTGTNETHIYTAIGNYDVKLNVVAANGCNNNMKKSLQIFNAPVAEFSLPSITPICTNQDHLLSNISTLDPGSNPSWEWRLNGILVSTQKDLTTSFNTTSSQEIRLKALIPGCENEKIQTIASVTEGPLVNFVAADDCQGNDVAFYNSTTGADTGYVWNFGDGNTSILTNPVHSYSSAAAFQTTLTASNSAGCNNFMTKPVKIYSLPQPDFTVSLPPFSCNNSPTPFQNNTPPLADSNITDWQWQFNDASGGSSSIQSPSYTYDLPGNYNVVLTATSDAGCSGMAAKGISIAASPTSDFTVGPSCLNVSTKFTDLSAGGVQSRFWQIGSASFTVVNPSYTFTSTGDFNTTLTATGANGCSNVKTKTVTVPVPPSLNFTVSNPCAAQDATFQDTTPATSDGVAGWNWNFSGNSETGNPAQFNFQVQGTYNVKMTTTHGSGCKYTFSRNIAVNPSPVAGFTAAPDRGAAPLTVQFINTSQLAESYLWRFYDKSTATSTRISPIYTFASLGDYTAELTASTALGCSDVMQVPIIVLVPSVDLIMKDFTLVSDPVTGKIKCLVTILNNSNVPVSSAEVALFLSDKAAVNETLVLNLGPGESGARTLSFSISPGQFDFNFLCAEIIAEKDIQQDNNKRCVNLDQSVYYFDPYPNPTSGMVQVDWIMVASGQARIRVYDAMGKKTYDWETDAHSGLNQAVLDLGFLTAGIYYISIDAAGAKKTMRLLRQ